MLFEKIKAFISVFKWSGIGVLLFLVACSTSPTKQTQIPAKDFLSFEPGIQLLISNLLIKLENELKKAKNYDIFSYQWASPKSIKIEPFVFIDQKNQAIVELTHIRARKGSDNNQSFTQNKTLYQLIEDAQKCSAEACSNNDCKELIPYSENIKCNKPFSKFVVKPFSKWETNQKPADYILNGVIFLSQSFYDNDFKEQEKYYPIYVTLVDANHNLIAKENINVEGDLDLTKSTSASSQNLNTKLMLAGLGEFLPTNTIMTSSTTLPEYVQNVLSKADKAYQEARYEEAQMGYEEIIELEVAQKDKVYKQLYLIYVNLDELEKAQQAVYNLLTFQIKRHHTLETPFWFKLNSLEFINNIKNSISVPYRKTWWYQLDRFLQTNPDYCLHVIGYRHQAIKQRKPQLAKQRTEKVVQWIQSRYPHLNNLQAEVLENCPFCDVDSSKADGEKVDLKVTEGKCK
jgi:hypothetical protein